jgi:hypothetical protein
MVGDANSITPPSSGVWRGHHAQLDVRRAGRHLAESMASAAFFSRFSSTCSIRIGSHCSVGQALCHVVVDRHVAAAQLDAGQLDGVVDDGRVPGWLPLRLALLHEGADAVDDLAARSACRAVLPSAAIRSFLFDGVGLHAARPCRCSSW